LDKSLIEYLIEVSISSVFYCIVGQKK